MIAIIATKLGLFVIGTLAFMFSDYFHEAGLEVVDGVKCIGPFQWGFLQIVRGFLMFFWAFCMAKILGFL